MLRANRPRSSVLGAILTLGAVSSGWPLGAGANVSGDAPSGDIVTGAWQHHKVTFDYFGVTTLFSCDGLEDHVREVLVHMGARKDASVIASGCPGPYGAPSHSAWVTADFYTLAPVAEAGRSDTVKARWTAVEVTPRRPNFMGDGDCELIEGMKDVITKNFSLRDMEYRTNCYPHTLSPDGFTIKGQSLKAVSITSSALTG